MANVGDMNLTLDERVEDEIAQARHDYDACIRLIDFSPGQWRSAESGRTIDQTRDNGGRCDRIFPGNIRVDRFQVGLSRPGKSNPHF